MSIYFTKLKVGKSFRTKIADVHVTSNLISVYIKTFLFLLSKEKENKLGWAEFKNTTVSHLLRTNAMPFAVSGIRNGGGKEIINATSHSNGPSWRMIVEMTDGIEAYGVYPGGQSGNPGSRYYDNFVDQWVTGKYYRLWLMKATEATDERVKWSMHFRKA